MQKTKCSTDLGAPDERLLVDLYREASRLDEKFYCRFAPIPVQVQSWERPTGNPAQTSSVSMLVGVLMRFRSAIRTLIDLGLLVDKAMRNWHANDYVRSFANLRINFCRRVAMLATELRTPFF